MRRPPAPFRRARVSSRVSLTPRLTRVTVRGQDLRLLETGQPASSVRVLLPAGEPADALEIPTWDGNRYVLADGRRPVIRTLTPRHFDREQGALQFDVVVHGDGAAARWASVGEIGTPVALSGPARGYAPDPAARHLVLGGDETAYAAVCSIVESVPQGVSLSVFLEVGEAEARPPLPSGGGVEWLAYDPDRGPSGALADRLGRVELPEDTRLWAAGEAAAMQRLRLSLFGERGLPRSRAVLRGYWKHGRVSEEDTTDAS